MFLLKTVISAYYLSTSLPDKAHTFIFFYICMLKKRVSKYSEPSSKK